MPKTKWGIAQLVERRTLDPKAEGSIPSSPAIILTTLRPDLLNFLPPESIGILKKEFGRFKTQWILETPFTKAMLDEGLTPGDLFTSGYFQFD